MILQDTENLANGGNLMVGKRRRLVSGMRSVLFGLRIMKLMQLLKGQLC
jgi:hypothetical protein